MMAGLSSLLEDPSLSAADSSSGRTKGPVMQAGAQAAKRPVSHVYERPGIPGRCSMRRWPGWTAITRS